MASNSFASWGTVFYTDARVYAKNSLCSVLDASFEIGADGLGIKGVCMIHQGASPFRGPISRIPPLWGTCPGDYNISAQNDRLDGHRSERMSDSHQDARESAEVRWDLVHRVRREIADGVYETPEKFEFALDRLLAQIDADD